MPDVDIPEPWLTWFFSALNDTSLDINDCLSTIAEKGFRPVMSIEVMHRAIVTLRFRRVHHTCKSNGNVIQKSGEQPPTNHSLLPLDNPAQLSHEIIHMVEECICAGIDGRCVLKTLNGNGVELRCIKNDSNDLTYGDLSMLQKLLLNHKENDTILLNSEIGQRNFAMCVKEGATDEVELYLSASLSIDDLSIETGKLLPQTPLTLASTLGYSEIVTMLIEKDLYHINHQDSLGCTALHAAAKTNNVEMMEILIQRGANIYIRDNYGNTPLHCAARCGYAKTTNILTTHAIHHSNEVLNDKVIVTRDGLELLSIDRVTTVFTKLLEEGCLKNEPQYFRREWVYSAASRVYHSMGVAVGTSQFIGDPNHVTKTIHHILQNIDNNEYAGYWSSEKKWIETIPTPNHLLKILLQIFRFSCVNYENKLGQTALHVACLVNGASHSCDSHYDVINILSHLCIVSLLDVRQKTPYDYLLFNRKGSHCPQGSHLRESYLFDLRADVISRVWDERCNHENKVALSHSNKLLEIFCREVENDLTLYSKTAPRIYLQVRKVEELLLYSDKVRSFGGYDEYIARIDNKIFYFHLDTLQMERSVVLIQRAYRGKFGSCIDSFIESCSMAVSFVKPRLFWMAERERKGWELFRQSAFLEFKVTLYNDEIWSKYFNAKYGESFYFREETGTYQWDAPNYQSDSDPTLTLEIGDAVYFKFAKDKDETICMVKNKVRTNEENAVPNFLYDIVETCNGPGKEIRNLNGCERAVLRKVPKSHEETRVDNMIKQWKTVIAQKRQKDLVYNCEGRETKIANEETKIFSLSTVEPLWTTEVQNDIRVGNSHCLDKHTIQARGHSLEWSLSSTDIEKHLVEREDKGPASPRTILRRQVLRTLHCSMIRQEKRYFLCRWGCGRFVKDGSRYQSFHEKIQCSKRVLRCALGCSLRLKEEKWMETIEIKEEERDKEIKTMIATRAHWHQKNECPKRYVQCGYKCGRLIMEEELSSHMADSCPKRPSPLIYECRLGCGLEISQGNLLEMIEERLEHELEFCPNSVVKCEWDSCELMMKRKDMVAHVQSHIRRQTIATFDTTGTYEYLVPAHYREVMVRVWGGAGGSSGNIQSPGNGGGGAFCEAIFNVSAHELLYVCVGEGGMGGVQGANSSLDVEDCELGISYGGAPGGGNGYGSGSQWAGGGGGGYSMIRRKTKMGNKLLDGLLVVAGGGGGGGSRNGCPGVSGDIADLDCVTSKALVVSNYRHKVSVDARIGGSGSN